MISIKNVNKKEDWEKFNQESIRTSFLQSWAWGDFEERIGKEVFRLGLFEEEKLVGICLLILERAKTATFFYVPEGPILISWEKPHLETLLKFISDIAKEKKASFLRLDPRILEKRLKNFLRAMVLSQRRVSSNPKLQH